MKFILQTYGIPIKLFGSCANGIAIKNSDIDIAIDGSVMNYFANISESEKAKYSLEWLCTVFQSFGCMKKLNLIKSARIPILKLEINTTEFLNLDQSLFQFDISQY